MSTLSSENKIVLFGIASIYLFYLSGTLYLVSSILGWLLFFVFLLRFFVEGRLPLRAAIPMTVVIWIGGMLIMLTALLVAHANFQLGFGQTLKSTIGWAKGWALIALFLFLGSVIQVKQNIIARACCILCSQTLIFIPISLFAYLLGLQGNLYVSPLKIVGGPISTFEVNLFGINPETGNPRWSFFSPWAPAAGLASCLYLVLCSQEKNALWRRLGISGTLLMCIFCQSRAGWAIYLFTFPALLFFNRINKPTLMLIAGVAFSGFISLGQPALEKVLDVHQQIKDARPDSTRVRSDLATIALQRWENEAPIWGHAVVEAGPKIVEFMPIGSHHSWYGLLYVKGLVGFLALAIPLIITFMYLVFLSPPSKSSWGSILIMSVILCYSFFENIEILAYLIWPALLWVGITLNPLKETGENSE